MSELLASTICQLPFVLAAVVALLLEPLVGRRVRTGLAIALAAGALLLCGLSVTASLVWPVQAADGTLAPARRSLDVLHVLPRRGVSTTLLVTEHVEAAPWLWPLVAAGALGLMAAWVFARRRHPRDVPRPLPLCAGVSLGLLALRLALEKAAAPAGLVQATALLPSTVLMLAFGASCLGRRGASFVRFLGWCALLAAAQRGALVGWSYLATTRHLGTHLDVHRLTAVDLPLFGAHTFEPATDAVAQWLWASVHQLTLWPLATVLLGLVVGPVPFVLGRALGQRHADADLVSGVPPRR